MMMKKIITAFLLAIALTGLAQSQKGYVRTISRPGVPSQRLSDVVVRVKTPGSVPNAVRSDEKGRFAIAMNNMSDGDPFSVTDVSKRGYHWKDKETGSTHRVFSSKVQMELVMVSKEQEESDQRKIADAAWAKAEKVHQSRQAELDRQLKEKVISEEKHRKAMEQLGVNYDKYTSLIDQMASYYANIDYDELTETDRKIASLIEQGELEEAQKLLDSVLDMDHVVEQQRAEEALLAERKELEAKLKKANRKMEKEVEANREVRANRLYMRHTTALGLLNFEEAAKCIRERAELDTLNRSWQMNAGDFLIDYMADYETALIYHERALLISESLYGEESDEVASCYNQIGTIFCKAGAYRSALHYTKLGADIVQKLHGKDSPHLLEFYTNLAFIYADMDSIELATDACQQALRANESRQDSMKLWHIYNCQATIHNHQYLLLLRERQVEEGMLEYKKACQYTEMELEVAEKLNDKVLLSHSLNDMATTYANTKDYDKCLDYNWKALEIKKQLYPEKHPSMATSYSNLGVAYAYKGDMQQAEEYIRKAIAIRKQVFGPENKELILSYGALAIFLKDAGMPRKAIEYYKPHIDLSIKNGTAPSDIELILALSNTATLYSELLRQDNSPSLQQEYTEFMADKAFVAEIMEGKEAAQQGMKGQYVLLEYEDWNLEQDTSLYLLKDKYADKPKHITVEQDGRIEEHDFEDKTGFYTLVCLVGAEQKAALIEAYRAWRQNHQQASSRR